MAKVIFVKSAAKDNPVAKKGESYYWWKHRFGPKQYSKERPTAAMTTSSEFLREAYTLNDDLAAFSASSPDDAETQIDDLAQRARDLASECQDKFDNMPEGLQQGSTGELLESRREAMEQLADDLEMIDCDFEERTPEENDEDYHERFEEFVENINSEVSGMSYDGNKENHMKVVINKQHGGFGLSHKAVMLYAKLKGVKLYAYADEVVSGGQFKLSPWDGPQQGKRDPFCVHYSTAKKLVKGNIPDKGYFHVRDIKRDDPLLVKVVEELGEDANGFGASLSIVEVPDGVAWQIDEYDGLEWVAEVHRTWS